MKILLAAVNAKFNHTNIAVRSISKYIDSPDVEFAEWTINMPLTEILRGISARTPDMVLFSTYIWNSDIIQKIIPDLKKILPGIVIGAGGPEAGFNAEFWLLKHPQLDFVISGEGEETVKEISEGKNLCDIRGLWIRDSKGKAVWTCNRDLICNLDDIPFPYDDFDDPEHKIYYYESSRGCPFSCSYCMSSMDKRVRFHSLDRVFADLKKFLDAGVSLVKFVDRTYNLKEERYIAIWNFILNNHNGKTMFHFEIEAEFLSDKALSILQTVPENIMQFEIGIQSCNQRTLEAVGRSKETVKLFENISKIPEAIHTHLDLIAGLPYENLESFGNSLEKVMTLKPDALQLGFLKVLHGTSMEGYAKNNGWQWTDNAPYEVLSTPYLSYKEILFLKDVEVILDAYWNSGIFSTTMNYILRKQGSWNFLCNAAEIARNDGSLDSARKTIWWFNWLAEHSKQDPVIMELLKFDFLKMGKTSSFPKWLEHRYSKKEHLEAMVQHENRFDSRIEFAFSEYDEFTVNPFAEEPEKTKGTYKVLFVYARHNSSIKNCQILL